jgi:hypothetical protein
MSVLSKDSTRIFYKISAKFFATSVFSCLVTSTLFLPSLILFTPSAQAQARKVRYVPPSNLDAPKVSSSGISRTDSFTPLEPRLEPNLEPRSSLTDVDMLPVPQTTSERPTIYFISPKVAGYGVFTLIEQNDRLTPSQKAVYRKEFSLQNEAGIIAFKMPEDAPIMEIGKIYHWRIDFGRDTEAKTTYGMIKRVLPTAKLVNQLKNISKPIDRAALFAQEGIWFETVQTLAEAQQTTPTSGEIVDEWTNLMKSNNLSMVLEYRFVPQLRTKESVPLPNP